jgi:hypothetical protein
MAFEDLLIIKGIHWVFNLIDEVSISVINGGLKIIFSLFLAWFFLYFLVWESFTGHLQRSLIIMGIWVFLEVSHWFGGGHN